MVGRCWEHAQGEAEWNGVRFGAGGRNSICQFRFFVAWLLLGIKFVLRRPLGVHFVFCNLGLKFLIAKPMVRGGGWRGRAGLGRVALVNSVFCKRIRGPGHKTGS